MNQRRRDAQAARVEADRHVSSARAWLGAAAISLVCFAIYANSLNGEFLLDDHAGITENDAIRDISDLRAILWPRYNHINVGRPLLNLSLAVNHAIGGADPFVYHLTNVFIHLAATLTLWGIARRTFVWPSFSDSIRARGDWLALAIALIWTAHPLQSECVSYIFQRAESQASLFYLLTLYAMIRGATAARDGEKGAARGWYAACVVSCLAGVLTKEIVVSAPLIALVYDRVFICGSWREVFMRRKWLYVGLFATWIPLACFVTRTAYGGNMGFGFGVRPWDYFQTQWWAVIHYLRLAVWPDRLIFDYGTRLLEPTVAVWACGAALLALAIATAVALWRSPKWGWLGLTFFAVLSPSSSFIPVTGQTIEEHRIYLPLAVVVTAAVIVIDHLWRRLMAGERSRSNMARLLPMAVVLAVVLALGYRTHVRNIDYRTELGIWTDTVNKMPNNARAQRALGVELAALGQHAAAVDAYSRAIAMTTGFYYALADRAVSLFELGRFPEALADFNQAIALAPEYAYSYVGRGSVLQRMGQLDKSLADFRRAIELQPDHAGARAGAGLVLFALGKHAEAVAELDEAIRLNPAARGAFAGRGGARWMLGDLAGAIDDYSHALELNANDIDSRLNRGMVYRLTRRNDLALADFTEVIRRQPNLARAYMARAGAHYDLGQLESARADVREFQRLGGSPPVDFLKALGMAGS